MKTKLLTLCSALAAVAGSASATIVFTEDFEGYGNTDDNTVATYDQFPPTPTGWVAANQGFNASQSGLNLDGTNTVYSFRYTNSGLTTTNGQIGNLTAGTYTITFDVLFDDQGASPFDVYLGTFATADDADRRDAANDGTNGFSSVLASVGGSYDTGTPAWVFSTTGSDNDSQSFSGSTATSTSVTFSYVSDGTEATAGQDVALRLDGATTSGNIDNVSIDFTPVPEPSSFALLAGCFGLAWVMVRRRG